MDLAGLKKGVFRLSSLVQTSTKPKHPESPMRTTRTEQPSVFQTPQIDHTVGDELELASLLLDQHPELLDMVGDCVGGSAACGRIGLTCETILRCAVIARLMDFSYRDLEFALRDSRSMQRFARVDPWRVPKKPE